ncbi:MAG TPA: tRNA preQ1(34) S-adenosylmethionine ribosyltransferase-isomerase QueA, partial [Candidatus Hypogeohydataceae bacterium YC40]
MKCDRELSFYDYPLPREYVAQHPLPRRDASRLMVLYRDLVKLEHRHFWDLPEYLREGDLLVLNNSRVLPTRLVGKRSTGGRVKLLLIEEVRDPASGEHANGSGRWRVILEARAKLREGEKLDIEEGILHGHLISSPPNASSGKWVIQLEPRENVRDILERVGRMPLPPYIKRPLEKDSYFLQDRERYQSVVATQPGSIAAPTASLHFTTELLQEISQKGVEIIYVTLHVGLGTFLPIRSSDITRHTMEKEYYSIDPEALRRLKETKRRGGRIIAVGSTSLRVLETVAAQGEPAPYCGWTNLFIHPPYKFKMADALLTNFHLPRSTLLVLVSAFAGRERILAA